MVFFTVPTTLNSLEGAAHLQSLERSLAQSFGQTPSSQPPSGDVELGWPHMFQSNIDVFLVLKTQFLENSFFKKILSHHNLDCFPAFLRHYFEMSWYHSGWIQRNCTEFKQQFYKKFDLHQ